MRWGRGYSEESGKGGGGGDEGTGRKEGTRGTEGRDKRKREGRWCADGGRGLREVGWEKGRPSP